ncbi:kinetochore CENP-C fungal-like protein [Lipomyces tetrasporus]|uniref:Kinetochore CENP-C fungal-like protein n=1 Tax=Lipomyces tetrasporus TaxID=54092 RepID=A0AAD7QX53_9ASCO|nr:kinetochore CENP-C fungal-like protein [Lipomyces tetrasporus]KAJ8102871.1 kinetochore CENP-C fungal-like protein [Lipomyces tetrasporus]
MIAVPNPTSMQAPILKRTVRPLNFAEIGIAGRKTGIRIADTGQRDSYGMESMDAFFSPGPTTGPVPVAATATSFGIHDENARTLDSETSMDITTSRSRVESPIASPRRDSVPTTAVLPRRTPVKTNIGSPARRSDIARRLDFGSVSREESVEASAEKIVVPAAITGSKRGLRPQHGKSKKPFMISDYDVLEDEEHASDSVGELEVDSLEAENQLEKADKLEKENQAPDEMDAKMRAYRELNDREKRESEENLKQIAQRMAKKSMRQVSQVKKNGVLHVQNTNVPAENKIAAAKKTAQVVAKRRIPDPPEPEFECEAEEDDAEMEEASGLSESEIESESESEDERFAEPKPKRAVKAKSAPNKTVPGKSQTGSKSVPPKSKAKPKTAPKPASQPVKASRRSSQSLALSQNIKRIVPEPSGDSHHEEDGMRRSKRVRVQPLAYWRNERIVYNLGERRDSGPALPQIKEIIMVDSPQSTSTTRTSAQRKSRAGSIFKRARAEEELSDDNNDSEPDEVIGEVNDFMDDEKIVKRRLAVSGQAIPFLQTASSSFKFAKTFDEPGGFMASGMVLLPVHGEKGSRPSRHNALAFCVVEGYVEVTIQDTVFRLRRGGHTIVPRGVCILTLFHASH